jgi:hypothetical protein
LALSKSCSAGNRSFLETKRLKGKDGKEANWNDREQKDEGNIINK